jgi:hypothetical protein
LAGLEALQILLSFSSFCELCRCAVEHAVEHAGANADADANAKVSGYNIDDFRDYLNSYEVYYYYCGLRGPFQLKVHLHRFFVLQNSYNFNNNSINYILKVHLYEHFRLSFSHFSHLKVQIYKHVFIMI